MKSQSYLPPANSSKPLKDKVEKWLAKEGYPLEFSVASIFRAAGFHIRQGEYVRGREEKQPREIDVAATITRDVGQSFLRVYQLIECKWSKDKPWVVFLRTGGIQPSALIAQALGSRAARALLWARAGDEALHELALFNAPDSPGFGGRQALAEKNDVFYATLQSVVDKAAQVASNYDLNAKSPGEKLETAVAVFPVVVVDGLLYTAAFDTKVKKLALKQVSQVRLHWRGAAAWRFHATIDIVSASYVAKFAKQRFHDSDILTRRLTGPLRQLQSCWSERSLGPLKVTSGPRGIVGQPALLREMEKYFQEKKNNKLPQRTD